MLEPCDLRIGNWITVMGSLPTQVTAEHLYMMETYVPVDPNEADYKEMTEPIRLSEEWLLKAGFVKMTKKLKSSSKIIFRVKHGNKGMTLDEYPAGFFLNYPSRFLRIDYVHQLQNLFYALTGNELIFNHG